MRKQSNVLSYALMWIGMGVLGVGIWMLNEEVTRLRLKLEPPRTQSVRRLDPFADR